MIDYSSGVWSVGTWFFWPIFAAGVFLAVLGLAWLLGSNPRGAGSVLMLGLILAVVSGMSYWPIFNGSFHQWYPVHGTVAATNSRIVSGDKAISQRFVIQVRETREMFGCDDTRCAALVEGEQVSLKCKREWQFQAAAGWACRWAG